MLKLVEKISLKNLSNEDKVFLLKELGFDSDGKFIIDDKGQRVRDKYIDKQVEIDNMIILPGSTIILDNNPLSIASYLEDYPDAL